MQIVDVQPNSDKLENWYVRKKRDNTSRHCFETNMRYAFLTLDHTRFVDANGTDLQ